MKFAQFVASPLRNDWIKEPGISIYIRRAIRKDADYDLANMQSTDPGKGSLTRFLDTYEPHYKFYIENIFNERLIPYFLRRGYNFANGHTEPQCMVGPFR